MGAGAAARGESESDSQSCMRTALLNHKLVWLHFFSSLRLTSDTVRETLRCTAIRITTVPFADSKREDFDTSEGQWACVGTSDAPAFENIWPEVNFRFWLKQKSFN